MEIYFVCCNVTEEKLALKEEKPERLLVSYHYFKNRKLKDLVEELGYKPIIMVDSGAYSAFTKGKNYSPIDYMNWLKANEGYYDSFINLDVIGDPELSLRYYDILKLKGFSPIPVYHYGSDEYFLQHYIWQGCDYIALGNTVPIKDKNKVAAWVNELTERYPGIKFHLLGSNSKKVTQNTAIYSADASTYIMMAVNGFPKEIPGMTREAKVKRARWHITKILEEANYESHTLFTSDCHS